MIIYLNRQTGEAFVCLVSSHEHLRKILFTEGRRIEKDFDQISLHPSDTVRFRALDVSKIDVTSLGPPDDLLT